MRSLLHVRRIRWAAPIAVLAAIGVMAAAPNLSASATPKLSPVSAEALLTKVQQANVNAISGTIELKANLGLPDLSSLKGAAGGGDGGFNATDFIAGKHSANVWASPDGFKITYDGSLLSQDSLVTNGTDLWTWQSQGTKVTHATLPAHTNKGGAEARQDNEKASPVKTPDQVAQDVLNQLTPSTTVSVSTPTTVAGRTAYELTLTPKPNQDTTVDHAKVAVDSATGVPLQLQLFAKGTPNTPALDFGFTKVSFDKPAKSTFTFTPPPNAKVTEKHIDTPKGGQPEAPDAKTSPTSPAVPAANQPTIVGKDWTTVAIFRNVQMPAGTESILRTATTVPGVGKLITTKLVNILVLDKGGVAVGAVSPSALEAAAASTP